MASNLDVEFGDHLVLQKFACRAEVLECGETKGLRGDRWTRGRRMDDFGQVVVFTIGMVVFVIWRASTLADHLKATQIPGRGSDRGLYFWGALILFASIVGGVVFFRLARDQ